MSLINSFDFLGTMAGNQTFLIGSNEKVTYARKYEPFGGSDDLRQRISVAGDRQLASGYKSIGEEYSYTPWNHWDGRSFGRTPGLFQGGGFF
jgi:hypothetical protein